jgi:hypothetical protein
MTRQEFIDKVFVSVLNGMYSNSIDVNQGMQPYWHLEPQEKVKYAYEYAVIAADERAKHCPFDDDRTSDRASDRATDPNKLPDEYWKDAPEWVNWAAMDAVGSWYWYGAKPILQDKCWSNRTDYFDFKAPPVPDWKQSLTPRPCK